MCCVVVKSTTQKFYIARLKGVLDKYVYLLSDQLSVFEPEFQILIFFFEDWPSHLGRLAEQNHLPRITLHLSLC